MWNRPDPNQNPVQTKKPAKWHGLAALVVVCVIGAAAILFFTSSSEKGPKVGPEKTSLIKEAKPALPAKPVVTNEVKKVDPNARPTKVGECVNGYVLLPSGRMHRRTGVVTNSIAGRPKAKYQIFDRRCNNEIAGLLTIKPGDVLLGTPRYNGRFKKDFIESISEPIIITEKDTPEQAQLKRDVIAARLEMKDALDRGEDIEQIMLDTRSQLQDLWRVKQQFQRLFIEQKKECKTEQDVEDLFNACNKMLEERGVAPIKYGPLTRRNLLRNQSDGQQTAAPVAPQSEVQVETTIQEK